MKICLWVNLILANVLFLRNLGNGKFKGYLGITKDFSDKYSYLIELVDARIKDPYTFKNLKDEEFDELLSFIYKSSPTSFENQNLKRKFIRETKVLLFTEFSYEYNSRIYFSYTVGKDGDPVFMSFLTGSFLINSSKQFYNVNTLKNTTERNFDASVVKQESFLKNVRSQPIKEAFRKLIYDTRRFYKA